MFQDILISPVIFLESVLSSLILPKATSVNPDYGIAASGAILSGLAVTGIIPEINSFLGLIMILVSMFVLFCMQTVLDIHDSNKTISIWSNCFGLSSYGIISGISLSLTSGLEFVQYTASIILSTLAISYSLGYRYIEYIPEFKDKLPILMFSSSTSVGLLIGRYFGLDSINTDLLLGISAGTFLMFGINNILMVQKKENIYLEPQQKKSNKKLICLSVLIGLTISGLLQSPIISDIIDSNSEILFNVTNSTDILADSNSTDIFNVTDSNSTDIFNVTV